MARKSAISSSERLRPRPSDASADRLRIAERAARLIIEGGLSDWQLAKRKAARQLGLPEGRNMPDQEEIILALRAHQSLFQAEEHAALLRARRNEALGWLELLQPFAPVLVGGVAEGWATEHTVLRIELSAASEKDVAFLLLRSGVTYAATGSVAAGSVIELHATRADSEARLVIGHDRRRAGGEGLTLTSLKALLADPSQDASQVAASRAK